MQAIDIVNQLKQNRAGQHVKVTWQRNAKTRKSWEGGIITKTTTAWVRAGIAYANLSHIKEGVEQGLREEVQSLPWGQWRDGLENYVIDHKGQEYVRLYPAVFDNLTPHVEWRLNGEPTTFEACEPYLLASERPQDKEADCFTVKAQDIIQIG